MDEFSKYLEDMRKANQQMNDQIEKGLRVMYTHLEGQLNQLNQEIEVIKNSYKVVGNAMDSIDNWQTEQNLQSSMEGVDVSVINQETVEAIESEYQNQMEPEMSAEEISGVNDEEQNYSEKMNTQEEPNMQKQAFLSLVKECKSGTMLEIDKQVIEKCIEKSVKPGVKVKNKPKTRKIDWERAKRNIVKFVGACVVVTSVGIIVGMHADDIYANHLRSEALDTYTETIYEPNTSKEWIYSDSGNRQIYVHDWRTLIEQTQNVYENPIVGFYMLYTKLDEESKKNYMNTIMAEFNLYYGTDYKDVEDILKKNNFKDFKALSKYVSFEIYRMGAEEVSVYDESQDSAVRR